MEYNDRPGGYGPGSIFALMNFARQAVKKFCNCSSVTLAVLSITTMECNQLSTEWSRTPRAELTSATFVWTALGTLGHSVREATLFPYNSQRRDYVLFHERTDCGSIGIRALRGEILVGQFTIDQVCDLVWQ